VKGEGRGRALRRIEVVGVFVATLFLYVGIPGLTPGVLSHPFISWDDDLYILHNPTIRGITWENFKAWWTLPYFGNYAPLHVLSYALNYTLRDNLVAADFHLTDALLHAGASVLALLLFRKLAGARFPALLATFLFAFHPVQVESVAWASQRKSTLAMFFLLASIALFLRHRDRTPEGIRSGWPTSAYLGSLACFLLSLLSKGTGVVLPVLLAIHERLADPRPRRKGRYAEIAPYGILALALGLATIWAQGGAGAIHSEAHPWHRFLTMTVVFRDYLRMLFLPVNLNNLYYPEVLTSALRPEFLASAVVLLGALTLTGWWVRRAPRAAFWASWFFVSLATVSGVLQLTVLRADRYLHLSSLALGGLAAEWLQRASLGGTAARRASTAAVLAVIGCFGMLTAGRIEVWESAERLWRDSVSKAPLSHIAHGSLGEEYLKQGNYQRAIEEYREAVRLQPLYAIGFFNIGFIEVRLGRMAEAAADLRRGLRAGPEPPAWNPGRRDTYASVHFYIAVQDFAEGRFREAEAGFRRALEYRPAYHQAAFNLGLVLARQGREGEAYGAFLRATAMQPAFYEAHREAALAALRGGASREAARRELEAALALRPDGPEAHTLRRALEDLLSGAAAGQG